ncbi:MAG TPA: outer membrane lipoprotein-sorting protein [bacterium]|nr:outer membrane lipoprotein-sorting protein [bacterium]
MRFGIPALAAAAAALMTLPAPAAAQAPDAEALMKQAHLNMYYAGDDGRSMVEMTMTDKRGKTRNRTFVMLRRDTVDGGEQKYFTYFYEPSDVRRLTFMVWKDPEADDARWIYVPAVDLVKQISANDKGSSFVGSDFSYEDVSGRPWTDDTHELLREEELDGVAAYVIQSVPKEKDSFTRKVTWIGKESMLPLKEEYYDRKDELERVFRSEAVETVGGYPTVVRRSMTNVKKNHSTTVEFAEIEYDLGVTDDVFTERRLKNPPSDLVSK